MSSVTVPFAQMAQAARAFVNKSVAPADDQTQALLVGVKQFLDGIASGQLVVTPAPKPTAGAEDSPAPAQPTSPPRGIVRRRDKRELIPGGVVPDQGARSLAGP